LVVPPPVTPPELLKAKALLSSIPIHGFRENKTSRKKQIWWRFVSPSFFQAALRVTFFANNTRPTTPPLKRGTCTNIIANPVESRRLCCLLFGPIFHLATKL